MIIIITIMNRNNCKVQIQTFFCIDTFYYKITLELIKVSVISDFRASTAIMLSCRYLP